MIKLVFRFFRYVLTGWIFRLIRKLPGVRHLYRIGR